DRAPIAFTIDEGGAGQPQHRGTLTIDRATGEASWEGFDQLSPGRRLRSILRFAHTGEVAGIVGQTIAGLVSLGAGVLVYSRASPAASRAPRRAVPRVAGPPAPPRPRPPPAAPPPRLPPPVALVRRSPPGPTHKKARPPAPRPPPPPPTPPAPPPLGRRRRVRR